MGQCGTYDSNGLAGTNDNLPVNRKKKMKFRRIVLLSGVIMALGGVVCSDSDI